MVNEGGTWVKPNQPSDTQWIAIATENNQLVGIGTDWKIYVYNIKGTAAGTVVPIPPLGGAGTGPVISVLNYDKTDFGVQKDHKLYKWINDNGSFFGSDHYTGGGDTPTPSPPPSGSHSNPFDGSGNPFGGLGGKFDLSGVDISGGWKQEAKELGKALAQMALVGLAAGLIVVVLFVSAQDLVWLTQKEHISSIPTNIKAPPYAKGPVTGHKFLYGMVRPILLKITPSFFPLYPAIFPNYRLSFI